MVQDTLESNSIGPTEWQMIQEATRGNGAAFTGLYDMYVKQVYRYVVYRVSNTTDAEDLTQEVFLRAWRSIKTYKPSQTPFLAWLYTIAHNLVVDWYRKNGRVQTVYIDDPQRLGSDEPSAEPEMAVDGDVLRRAMGKLPPDQQRVLHMRFVDGMEYPEVAAALGKSQGAVRVIQLRALQRLRRILEEEPQ